MSTESTSSFGFSRQTSTTQNDLKNNVDPSISSSSSNKTGTVSSKKSFFQKILNFMGVKNRLTRPQKSKIAKLFKDMEKNSASLHTNLIKMHRKELGRTEVGVYLSHYLQKSAGWDAQLAREVQRPVVATDKISLQSYHRDYDARSNALLNQLGTVIKNFVNGSETDPTKVVSEKEILFSKDGAFKETLEGYSDVIDINAVDDFDAIIDTLIKDSTGTDEGDSKKNEFVFVFVDRMVDSSLPYPERVKKVKEINQELIGKFEKKITRGLEDGTINKEQALVIRIRLGILSQQDCEGNTTLIIPNYYPPPGQSNTSMLGQMHRAPFLRHRIALGGHTPTMMQGRKFLHHIKGKELFSAISGKGKKIKLQKFKTMKEFLSNPSIVSYAKLGGEFRNLHNGDPSTIALLSSANTRMIESLAPHLEIAMTNPDNARLINASLNRVAYLMEQSVESVDNHGKFSLYHELISEELILLLSLVEPHKEGDFQKIFLQNRDQALDQVYGSSNVEASKIKKKRPTLDPAIKPAILPMASGMSCVDGVVRGLRKQKPNISISCLSDNYFETFATLETMTGASIKGELKPSFNGIDVNDIDGSIDALKEKGKDPDLVFFDLRSSPSIDAKEYSAKQIDKIAKKLLEGRTKEKPLTIALDVTLDKLHSRELNEFLCKHQDAIKEGRLNIVLYRSGHKFDQLGVDKFNAGYMEVYTADEETRKDFSDLSGQLAGIDFQALCHFHQNADREIHQYLKRHYKNTDMAYERMSDLRASKGSFLQFTPKNDRKLYYIEFTYPSMSKQAGTFQSTLMEYANRQAKKEGVALVQRDSFGFNESTICVINSNKTRLSVGSHPPEELDKLCQIFTDFEKIVQDSLKEVGGKVTEKNEQKFMDSLKARLG
jgi:hypothetical protein